MKKRYVTFLFTRSRSPPLSPSLSLSRLASIAEYTGRRFEYSRPFYDQRGNGFIVAVLLSFSRYPYVSTALRGPDNRHRARGTRSGTILAFHTAKTHRCPDLHIRSFV